MHGKNEKEKNKTKNKTKANMLKRNGTAGICVSVSPDG